MPRQLILRLPPRLADRLRSLLSSGKLDENTASCRVVHDGNIGGDQSHGGDKSRESEETIKVGKVEKNNEGTKPGSRWVFTLEGESYPARLVNLPTNVETHKTVDKVTYYKSSDVGQMMVVYENEEKFKADGSNCNVTLGGEKVYADGLTPPMRNVVRRKFHRASPPWGKFTKTEVQNVEGQVLRLIQVQEAKDDDCIETVYEETVKLEPWMIDQDTAKTGRISGITLEVNCASSGGAVDDDKDKLFGHEILLRHPELLLSHYEFPTVPPPSNKVLDDESKADYFAIETADGGLYVPEEQEEDLDIDIFGDLDTEGFLPSSTGAQMG